MRYTAMMWMRRANMAALGGGADIMPDLPDDTTPDEYEKWCDEDTKAALDELYGPEPPDDTDPMSDAPFEKENNI